MKVLKVLATILVTLIVLVAVLVGIALVPSVQTWAVRKAVAGQPGMKLDVGRVAAGLSSADLRNVHLVKNGADITADHVAAQYSAWDFITHHRITVSDLTTEGLVVDLRHSQPAASTAASQPAPASTSTAEPAPSATAKADNRNAGSSFSGVLNQIQLPYDLHIARFSIPGRALLPNDVTATFEVHGSDITTGQRGTVDWKLDTISAQTNAPIHSLHSTGTAAVHITTERRIDLADVNAVASVEGAGLPSDQFHLDAKAEQPTEGGNEGYSLRLAVVRASANEPLLTVAAQYDASAHHIAGAWDLTVHRQQVAALLSSLGLPDLSATGAGKFTLDPSTNGVSADGDLQTDLSQLQKISPDLAAIGTLHVRTNFAGALANNVAQLDHLALTATTAEGRHLADINTLQRVSFSLESKRVSFADAKADLAHITVQDFPAAWAQPFVPSMKIDGGTLSLALAVAAEADGSRVRLTSIQPVTVHDLTVRNGQQTIADHLSLTVKPLIEYSPEKVHAELNDLNATMPTGDSVAGKIIADVTNPTTATRTIAFSADTQAKVVAALKPYLPADVGALAVTSTSQGSMAGNTLKFEHSTTTVGRPGGGQLLRFELLQPLSIDTRQNTFTTPKPDATTARVQVANVPLAWAETFVKGGKFSGEVTGGTVELTLRALTDIAATTTEPLSVRGVSISMNGEPMLQNLDAVADFSAAKKGDVVTYELRRFEAKQGPASLANLAVSGNLKLGAKPSIAAKGTLQADAAALMQQPAIASYGSLTRGTVNVSFDASIADMIQAKTTLNARDLVAKQGNRQLGDATLTLTATVQSDGSSRINMPFVLTNGTRKSDLLLDGKLARTGNSVSFDGRVTSNQLYVDDLQPLAALVPASKPPTKTPGAPATAPASPTTRPSLPVVSSTGAPSAAPAPAARDLQPFWNGFSGKLDLDLKQVVYGGQPQISDVRGSASITPQRLALTSLDGNFKANPFKVSSTIDFDANQPQPYTLNASANFTNVDVGALLQAANPNEKPELETSVTVNANLQGKGSTLDDLLQHAYGKFDATGSKGVLRALANKQNIGLAVGIGSLAMQLAQKNSDTAAALADLTRKLNELPFDQFKMQAERGSDLNLKITTIEFVSPDTHITGNGLITNQPGVPLLRQPMQLTLQIAGKEDMAVLLNRLHMLSNQTDSAGYQLMAQPFTESGTVSQMGSTALWKAIASMALPSAAQGVGNALQSLFGRR